IESEVAYEAPRNEVEEVLSSIFAEVLQKDRVGIHDNFFELGGDSIKAIRVMTLSKDQGYPFNIRYFMENPTVEQLAQYFSCEIQGEKQEVELKDNLRKRFFCQDKGRKFEAYSKIIKCEASSDLMRLAAIATCDYHSRLALIQEEDNRLFLQSYEEIQVVTHLSNMNMKNEEESVDKIATCLAAKVGKSNKKVSDILIVEGEKHNYFVIAVKSSTFTNHEFINICEDLLSYTNTQSFYSQAINLDFEILESEKKELTLSADPLTSEEYLSSGNLNIKIIPKETSGIYRSIITLNSNTAELLAKYSKTTIGLDLDQIILVCIAKGLSKITPNYYLGINFYGAEWDGILANQAYILPLMNEDITFVLAKNKNRLKRGSIAVDSEKNKFNITYNSIDETMCGQATNIYCVSEALVISARFQETLSVSFDYQVPAFNIEDIEILAEDVKRSLEQVAKSIHKNNKRKRKLLDYGFSDLEKEFPEYFLQLDLYGEQLEKNSVVYRYRPTYQQAYFLKMDKLSVSMSNVTIYGEYSRKKVIDAIKQIISEESVLRTSYDSYRNYLIEHGYTNTHNIAFIDIRNSSVSNKQLIEDVERKYVYSNKKNEDLTFFLSKISCIQFADDAFYINILIHHAIWDMSSGLAFERRLKKILDEEKKANKVNNYFSQFINKWRVVK
ncbi:MAG TPA: hypothetical protein GXZ76_07980, partial [Clostridiaceae bacterium]|nr:hypothetical protein [Clostridiaceae bacterium]